MLTNKLTDIEIAVRIVPTRVRWPDSNSGTVWVKAHRCVQAFENIVREVDLSCSQAEQHISVATVHRRRADFTIRRWGSWRTSHRVMWRKTHFPKTLSRWSA